MNDDIRNLLQALYQAVGNKVYMRDIEALLRASAASATPGQKDALRFLAADLRQLDHQIARARREPWRNF